MIDKLKSDVMNIKKSKKRIIYTLIAVLIVIVAGITFAWWQWSSDINALIYGKVCAPEIVFVGGTTINGHDLLPVRTKEEGLTKDIDVNLNNTCDNDTAVLNLNLYLESFPSGLADASFKWAVYRVTTEEVQGVPTETLTYVSNGNFANKVQTDTISIATDLIVTENISTYRLFIWIDALMDNPSTIGDNSFRFKLYGTGRDAIYREYTMSQQAPGINSATPTSPFWGSSINRNQVKSITFTNLNKKPLIVSGEKDISSVAGSGSVIMWWIENGQTTDATPITLYDVYVGSNNGIVKSNTSGYNMFINLKNCEYMDLEGFDTSNMTSMESMLSSNTKVNVIKLSNWNTSKVTSMKNMFKGCQALTSLDVSNFDTAKVNDFESMFWMCSNLMIIDVSHWVTSAATKMTSMFYNCSNVKKLDVSGFNTSKVTSIRAMFHACSSLTSLDISGFDTEKISDLYQTFKACSNLKRLDLSNFSSLTSMYETFTNDSRLEYIDLSNLDFSNIVTTTRTFTSVPSSTEIIVKDCDQYNNFISLWNNRTGLHTLNNNICPVV